MIGKTLESFTKLYNSLSETKIFLDTLIIELVGGGKYSWLERLVVQDNEISFISNAGFDLKGKVDELLGKLERADTNRLHFHTISLRACIGACEKGCRNGD